MADNIDFLEVTVTLWREIANENDVKEFLDIYDAFHDSCIKNIEYVSGAYVSSDLSMHPINEVRKLRVVFERQRSDPKSVELEFRGLLQLVLMPYSEMFTCEIHEAAMRYEERQVVWYIGEENNYKEGSTLIRDERARWRVLE